MASWGDFSGPVIPDLGLVVELNMHRALCASNADLPPTFARLPAGTDEPVADHPAHGRPQLVALAFDADGHYTPTVIRHPVNDTPWGEVA